MSRPEASASPELGEWARGELDGGGDALNPVGYSDDALLALLAELARRRAGPDAPSPAPRSEAAIKQELAARRRSTDAAGADETRRRQPLRVRLLDALAGGQQRSSELADAVGATREAVSRALTGLSSEGLVAASSSGHDRRARVYALTAAGGVERRELLAYATDADAWNPFEGETPRPRADAVAEAVRMRRTTTATDAIVEQLEQVIERAGSHGVAPLRLHALAELLITLRQADRYADWQQQIELLRALAHGVAEGGEPTVVAPAMAFLSYELGRGCGNEAKPASAERATDLLAAARAFGRLRREDAHDAAHWGSRRAWSIYSLADVYREETSYGDAVELAGQACSAFEKLGDEFGAINAAVLQGMCLRLRGQFVEAVAVLEQAVPRARQAGFDRLCAGALAQLGETSRVVDADDAREHLEQADAMAEDADAHVTRAFAQSSLASLCVQQEEWPDARDLFDTAHAAFCRHGYAEGIALNQRRRAVMERLCSGSLDAADSLVDSARRTYDALNSPAGVAACVVESGHIALARGGAVDGICDTLWSAARDAPTRTLLVLDPWVPAMIVGLAEAAGEHGLAAEAEQMRSESARDASPGIDSVGLQMAGEPRRVSELAQSTLAAMVTAS